VAGAYKKLIFVRIRAGAYERLLLKAAVAVKVFVMDSVTHDLAAVDLLWST